MVKDLKQVFEQGNFARLRQLANESSSKQGVAFLDRIGNDPKMWWAGLAALLVAILASWLTLS